MLLQSDGRERLRVNLLLLGLLGGLGTLVGRAGARRLDVARLVNSVTRRARPAVAHWEVGRGRARMTGQRMKRGREEIDDNVKRRG
eukprot:scaffold84724_cov30-Tisochrysis_lutea.AAC.1